MQQFSNQEIAELKSRVDQIQELLAGRAEEPAGAVRVDPGARREAPLTAERAEIVTILNDRSIAEAAEEVLAVLRGLGR